VLHAPPISTFICSRNNICQSEDKRNGKGEVPVLNYAPRHEDILGEWRYSSTHPLTSALDGGEWSASRPGRFAPRKRTSGIRWIGGWVGLRAGLDTVVKRKFPRLLRESNPDLSDHPAHSQFLYRLSSPGFICQGVEIL
jgi:hypothetical protein